LEFSGEASGCRTLWERLGEIPDRRGRQYGLAPVLTLALAAILSGANDLRAIFRWGRRLPPEALYLLGLELAPCHAVYHYFFNAPDIAATEQVLGAWVRGTAAVGYVAPDGNEITAALALIKGLPLEGAVMTGDAAFCQRAICQGIRDRQGEYLFTVKSNQPMLLADLAVAFGDPFPPGTDQSPGRAASPAHECCPPPI